ncbi:LysR family transcriptional regulator [Labrenzia sp. PHM005]|nr:LysR family transcriptional regulator [Labrenzia sp. PHM005]
MLSLEMRISARQIELFQMAYRLKSTRRAAEALNITQPAISRAVADIETEMGLALFDRTGKKFEPTAAAHSLHKAVQQHYQGLQRVLEAAEKISTGIGGLIRVVSVPAIADTRVAASAGRLMARFPDLRFDVDVMSEQAALTALREGKADCAIISSDPGEPSMKTTVLADLKPIAILPENDPFADLKEITPEVLAKAPLVMLPADSPFRQVVERMLSDAGASFETRAAARTQSALIWMVSQGAGRAIVDEETLNATAGVDVIRIPLRSTLRWPIRAVTASANQNAPGLAKLIQELQLAD